MQMFLWSTGGIVSPLNADGNNKYVFDSIDLVSFVIANFNQKFRLTSIRMSNNSD